MDKLFESTLIAFYIVMSIIFLYCFAVGVIAVARNQIKRKAIINAFPSSVTLWTVIIYIFYDWLYGLLN